MPERLKMLTPSSVDLRKTSRSTGGALKPEDVKGALAKLSESASALAYAKYLQHPYYERVLFDLVFMRIWDLAEAEDWPAGKLQPIVRCIIEDVMERPCRACQGVASMRVGDQTQVCTVCHGAGRKGVSAEQIARKLGIPTRTYYRSWRGRYASALAVIRAWDDEIRRVVRRQLR